MDADIRDINRIRQLRRRRIARCYRGPRRDFFQLYDGPAFTRRYRLCKNKVRFLINLLRHDLVPRSYRRNCISAELQVLITLRYFATGSFQMAVGDMCVVSQRSVSTIVRKVSRLIAGLKDQFIFMPDNDEINQLKEGFHDIANFPDVFGCIDCTHVPISKPRNNLAAFFNRKGFYSINVQLVCDHQLRIRNVVARWGGATHDSRIFENSELATACEQGQFNGHMVGDSGYACRPYLLTPVLNPTTQAERNYNAAHILTRNPVERTIGVVKSRFRCISHDSKVRIRTERAMAVIVAACVLHNIELEPDANFNDGQALALPRVPQHHVHNNPNNPQGGQAFRRQFIRDNF